MANNIVNNHSRCDIDRLIESGDRSSYSPSPQYETPPILWLPYSPSCPWNIRVASASHVLESAECLEVASNSLPHHPDERRPRARLPPIPYGLTWAGRGIKWEIHILITSTLILHIHNHSIDTHTRITLHPTHIHYFGRTRTTRLCGPGTTRRFLRSLQAGLLPDSADLDLFSAADSVLVSRGQIVLCRRVSVDLGPLNGGFSWKQWNR